MATQAAGPGVTNGFPAFFDPPSAATHSPGNSRPSAPLPNDSGYHAAGPSSAAPGSLGSVGRHDRPAHPAGLEIFGEEDATATIESPVTIKIRNEFSPPSDSSVSGASHGRPASKAVWELLDEEPSAEKQLPAEVKSPGTPVWLLADAEQQPDSEALEQTSDELFPKEPPAVCLPASHLRKKGKEKMQEPLPSASLSPQFHYTPVSLSEALAVGNQRDPSNGSQMGPESRGRALPQKTPHERLPAPKLVRRRTRSEPDPSDPGAPGRHINIQRPQDFDLNKQVLESHEDIRCPPLAGDENFAIRPGSLVICIDDIVLAEEEPEDNAVFERQHGDAYIVVRIYPDRWASCVKLSLTNPVLPAFPPDGRFGRKDCRMAWPASLDNVGFLPLCSVTLAANFNDYRERSCQIGDASEREPHTGQLAVPPRRSYSREAEQQVREGGWVRLPRELFDIVKRHDAKVDRPYKGNEAFLRPEIGHGFKAKPEEYVTSTIEWPERRAWRWGFVRHTFKRQRHRLIIRFNKLLSKT